MRPICIRCNSPRSINCIRNGKIYYRSLCNRCLKNSPKKRPLSWEKSGYTKKLVCDRCGYRAKSASQLDVFHIDGDLLNTKYNNLKTVCANCQRLFGSVEKSWKIGDLVPDF